MIFVKQLTIFVAALCMIVAALRHRKWRGGLILLGCMFLSVAVNELGEVFRPLFPGMQEPELVPVIIVVSIGVVLAIVNYGTSVVALKAIYENRRFPLLVCGLLVSVVLSNVAESRTVWLSLLPVDKDTSAVCGLVGHAVELLGYIMLLNWAILFLWDKWTRLAPCPSEHEHLLFEHPLVEVGRGSRRVCYKIGDTGYCAKFYISPDECSKCGMKRSVRWDIFWRRFNKFTNACSLEVHIWTMFSRKMPRDIKDAMPVVMERVFHPKWGWGVLETYYKNPDGTPIIPYELEIARQTPENREKIYLMARNFLGLLISHSMTFYEPGNFHVLHDVDGNLSLKIVDFEPNSKTLVQVEAVWPWFRRRKLARKSERYLRHLREAYGLKGVDNP